MERPQKVWRIRMPWTYVGKSPVPRSRAVLVDPGQTSAVDTERVRSDMFHRGDVPFLNRGRFRCLRVVWNPLAVSLARIISYHVWIHVMYFGRYCVGYTEEDGETYCYEARKECR